ncbi:hypothetical protein OGAPHI_002046 [Ogataea philodendri]|uniref:Uncharacterized protein n=1 Tax=Ogataea philodendri TaxID=1378263 RepID=A0A9P8PBH9_9ASCO|nr:uncharacterized protein OGAPHI_002046 [Ogataea philodendri]KAH3668292.1 hypothetical protein OGAPHI_002046 [Ogataea philodendri]
MFVTVFTQAASSNRTNAKSCGQLISRSFWRREERVPVNISSGGVIESLRRLIELLRLQYKWLGWHCRHISKSGALEYITTDKDFIEKKTGRLLPKADNIFIKPFLRMNVLVCSLRPCIICLGSNPNVPDQFFCLLGEGPGPGDEARGVVMSITSTESPGFPIISGGGIGSICSMSMIDVCWGTEASAGVPGVAGVEARLSRFFFKNSLPL